MWSIHVHCSRQVIETGLQNTGELIKIKKGGPGISNATFLLVGVGSHFILISVLDTGLAAWPSSGANRGELPIMFNLSSSFHGHLGEYNINGCQQTISATCYIL